MPEVGKPQRLSRRGVVRARGGPLRQVKLELGIVVLLLITVWLITLGIDAAAWIELLALFAAACVGGGWIAWRARSVARRWNQEQGLDGGEKR